MSFETPQKMIRTGQNLPMMRQGWTPGLKFW